jgi:predicted nucleic acid-binding protein
LKAAYIDSSVIIAASLNQLTKSDKFFEICEEYEFFSSYLLAAETYSAMKREKFPLKVAQPFIERANFLSRPIHAELFKKGLKKAYVRGADLYHIATALLIRENYSSQISFFSLDSKQSEVAKKCGLKVIRL